MILHVILGMWCHTSHKGRPLGSLSVLLAPSVQVMTWHVKRNQSLPRKIIVRHLFWQVILGGIYGTGRRGGQVAEYVLGLVDARASAFSPASYKSFCKQASRHFPSHPTLRVRVLQLC